jgi:hypothetical protein
MHTLRLIALMLIAASLVALGSSAVLAEPRALYGKSVIVTWTEERMQRREGQDNYRPAIREGTFNAYVSSTGRIFNRVSMANPRRDASGKRDRIGNGQRLQITLSGRTMTTVQVAQAGGARRIAVQFDDSFTSCTAEVIRGKEEGAEHIVGNSMIRPGARVEIASVKTSGVRCAVKEGNVFGGE